MKITDKLKNKVLSTIELNESQTIQKVVVKNEKIKEHLNLEILKKLNLDEETEEFLKKSTIELFQIQTNSTIELGKIFHSVFEELSKQGSQESVYEEWLKLNGFNKRTALRYRKRYELYKLVDDDKKYIIAGIQQKYIEEIYQIEKREIYLELIRDGASIKEIGEMVDLEIETKKIFKLNSEPCLEFIEEINIPIYINFSEDISEKIKTLEDEKRKKLNKHFNEIDKLLKE